MRKERIVKLSLNEAAPGKTDWSYLDRLTDEDIDRSIAEDPDWADLDDIDWAKAEVVTPPRKRPISIRVDEDVLEFFKRQGAGYQRRMNAVLRAYMTAAINPKLKRKRS